MANEVRAADQRCYTAFFKTGEALNRTVFPAFTLTGSPVRGFSAFRAFILCTVKVPNPGSVNLPEFFSSLTIAPSKAAVARFAATPVMSKDWRSASEIKALDMQKPFTEPNLLSALSQPGV